MISLSWLATACLTVLMLVLTLASAWCLAHSLISNSHRVGREPQIVATWPTRIVESDTDIAQMLMATSMAAMVMPTLAVISDADWETIFIVLGIWFGCKCVADVWKNGLRALARKHHLAHCIHCAAMLYMLVGYQSMNMGPDMVGTNGFNPIIALLLVVHGMWDLFNLNKRRKLPRSGTYTKLPVACRVGTAMGMAVMFIGL